MPTIQVSQQQRVQDDGQRDVDEDAATTSTIDSDEDDRLLPPTCRDRPPTTTTMIARLPGRCYCHTTIAITPENA